MATQKHFRRSMEWEARLGHFTGAHGGCVHHSCIRRQELIISQIHFKGLWVWLLLIAARLLWLHWFTTWRAGFTLLWAWGKVESATRFRPWFSHRAPLPHWSDSQHGRLWRGRGAGGAGSLLPGRGCRSWRTWQRWDWLGKGPPQRGEAVKVCRNTEIGLCSCERQDEAFFRRVPRRIVDQVEKVARGSILQVLVLIVKVLEAEEMDGRGGGRHFCDQFEQGGRSPLFLLPWPAPHLWENGTWAQCH